MSWTCRHGHADPPRMVDGYCLLCRRISNRRYALTEEGRAIRRAADKRYRAAGKRVESDRKSNEQRIRAGDMYLGRMGFTQREREELVRHGTPD